jgi:hypothetical protein
LSSSVAADAAEGVSAAAEIETARSKLRTNVIPDSPLSRMSV